METSTNMSGFEVSTQQIQANGLTFNLCSIGTGTPVVLLHGFPDSLKLWRHLMEPLAANGYRLIAYDQRGFGQSDAPAAESDYHLDLVVADLVAILQGLEIEEPVFLIGHDWGAFVGWLFCLKHPQLVRKFIAVSVGHPLAFKHAGLQQKLKSWYVFFFQVRGIAEWQLSKNNWAAFRKMAKAYPEADHWIADLSRPGRLTAALNWYRANFSLFLGRKFGKCKVPTMGVHSEQDVALTVKQMVDSRRFMDAEWKYVNIDHSSHWIPLDQPAALLKVCLAWFQDSL